MPLKIHCWIWLLLTLCLWFLHSSKSEKQSFLGYVFYPSCFRWVKENVQQVWSFSRSFDIYLFELCATTNTFSVSVATCLQLGWGMDQKELKAPAMQRVVGSTWLMSQRMSHNNWRKITQLKASKSATISSHL